MRKGLTVLALLAVILGAGAVCWITVNRYLDVLEGEQFEQKLHLLALERWAQRHSADVCK